jgi:alanine racemase
MSTDSPRHRVADIARQAGVSPATVSRVLNDRPGVSGDKRQSVFGALDVLGIDRPERRRQQRPAGLVGLVTPELDNPIFPHFAQVIGAALAQHGHTPVLCTQTPGGVTEDEFVELLVERSVAGIVFVSGLHADTTATPDRYQSLVSRRLPIVLVNGYLPGIEAPFFSCDDAVAGRLAVNHLVSLGHERIGLISGPERYVPVRRKLAGYRAAMKQHGLAAQVELSLFGVEGGQAATTRLIERGVTGVICGSDLMALGAVRAVRERGLSVPGDVSVIGYDDSALIPFTDPPLTTLRQPVGDMSKAAVRALIEAINGQPAPATEFMFRPELVVRSSTGPAPAQRPR